MKRAVLLAAVTALLAASATSAATANFTQYRARVNGICRSYTPKFKKLEADMATAKRAGDVHRYAYDFGKILGMGLAQGVTVEKTPVPADGRARMAPTLRLLHASDAQLRQEWRAGAVQPRMGVEGRLVDPALEQGQAIGVHRALKDLELLAARLLHHLGAAALVRLRELRPLARHGGDRHHESDRHLSLLGAAGLDLRRRPRV